MDKRYLLIIVITLICLVNLYIISSNSDEIGSATVIAGDYMFKLPENFDILPSNGDPVSLQNHDNNLNVKVYTNQKKTYDFNKKVEQINNHSNAKILSNGTINVSGVTVDAIYYTYYPENISGNFSVFIFSKEGSQFEVDMNNFNYKNDLNNTIETLDSIVDSIRVNHKKWFI